MGGGTVVVVTEEHLAAAKAAGACSEAMRDLRVGMDLSDVSREWLEWAEEHLPKMACDVARQAVRESGVRVRGTVPLSMLGYGSGSGYGSGYGSGDGYGDGYGDGSGSGDGDGDGDGDGGGAS